MSSMDTDELPVVLPSHTTSTLSLSLHPLPILNISEHLTRLKLQNKASMPFVVGALLGTQNGREVEIVNSFELATDGDAQDKIDHAFCVSRKDQYKQVFPSLDVIGWYSAAQQPTGLHIALHEQFLAYTPNPILLILQPLGPSDVDGGHALPFKAYESTVEVRERSSRNVFIEAPFSVETGEAERIAVDWTAKGGEGGMSLESHLRTQRAAVKMLHDRIQLLIQYIAGVAEGTRPADHTILRSISALVASLPASERAEFRQEFDREYDDVQLTAVLSNLTKSVNALNNVVDKYMVLNSGNGREDRLLGATARRRGPGRGIGISQMGGMGDWDRFH